MKKEKCQLIEQLISYSNSNFLNLKKLACVMSSFLYINATLSHSLIFNCQQKLETKPNKNCSIMHTIGEGGTIDKTMGRGYFYPSKIKWGGERDLARAKLIPHTRYLFCFFDEGFLDTLARERGGECTLLVLCLTKMGRV